MTMSAMLIARGVARGIHVAGSLSILGIIGASLFILPDLRSRTSIDMREQLNRVLNRLVWISLLISVVFGFVWLVFESIYVADSNILYNGLATLMPVIWYTNFGHLLVIRVALLSLAAGFFAPRESAGKTIIALGRAVLATALQAGLGHGAAMSGMEGTILLAALTLHLLAAGLWLGGLLPLLIATKTATLEVSYSLAKRFSVLGTICVATLAFTAAVQGWFLAGGISGLIGTAYGRVAIAKLILFLVLTALAALNRNSFTPALLSDQGFRAKSHLRKTIGAEVLVGLTIVILAGILLELPPGMDMAMAGNM